MTVLSENMVFTKTRTTDLKNVRQLNCWGSELQDVSIVRQMPFVQVLSLSVNSIESLADFAYCQNLHELYLRDNKVSDLSQLIHLQALPKLTKLWLAGNPCADVRNYRLIVLKLLPNLEMLDNIPVTRDELIMAENIQFDVDEETGEITTQSDEAQQDYPVYQAVQPAAAAAADYYEEEETVPLQQQHVPVVEVPKIHPMQRQHSTSNQSDRTGVTSGPSNGSSNASQKHVTTCHNNTSAQNRNSLTSDSMRLLPKGGRNRNANILSAILCLVKELDAASLEVVDTEIHCRMEELGNA